MPFTVSHIAAVLPLRRLPILRALPLSALVIGSMLPDFAFLAGRVDREISHGFAGLFLFCLPMGWLVQLVFWHGLQAPLLDLAPRPLQRRLQAVLGMESRGLLHVSAGLLLGALTHIIWDAFTHAGNFGVQALPLLQTRVLTLGGEPLFAYELLQHFSSALGLIALAMYACRWFTRSTPEEARTTQYRVFWLLALLLVPGSVALLTLLAWLPIEHIDRIAAVAAGRSLEAAGLCLLAYALWWHRRRSVGRRQGAIRK
ncbi:MAG: DUF4184 family protein [Rhodocyclaceae bacterium]